VDELARRVIESLRVGAVDPAVLARAGAPQPAEDAHALRDAANDPDLSAQLDAWLPPLLTSASPGSGARRLVSIAAACRDTGHAMSADPALLARVAGNSHFLGRWLIRDPSWLADLSPASIPAPGGVDSDSDWSALRRTKYRGLLRVAARDLAGRPFDEGLVELSDLADAILRRALTIAADGKTPPALFALGKLGGRELNYSSDVDLLFVCDAPPDEHGHAAREDAARVVRALRHGLEERSEEGFGYRVDLDLRPEGPAGPLARGVEGTLGYYELRGAEWERQMLLRLRHVAGAPEAAREFQRGIEPFVYRRTIDPGVIGAVRAMKGRIESERRESGHDLDGNLKEAPGGIRDVEFTVQALQLFYAGRHPELRTGNVFAAIAALAEAGLLPKDSAAALEAGYRWLRRAEHALQLAEEQQTAQLPVHATSRTALARRMGYAEPEGEAALRHFERDRDDVQSRVREHFEALVLGETVR
jgi:glutamate-ammonia-ligase adenylyltransferase